METIIDTQGRITIPHELQVKLGLKPGMRLEAEAANGSVVLTPSVELSQTLSKPSESEGGLVWEDNVLVYRGTPPISGEEVNKLIELLDKERDEKIWNPEG